MSALPRTYRFLAGLEDGAVEDALVVGVRELDGPYLRFAVEVLLQRARSDGVPAVIDCYHRLPADLKERVLESAGAVAPLLRTAVRGEQLQTRLNSLEIASRIGSESLAYLFDMGLMDSQPKVRELAALTMRRMAEQLLKEHPLLCGENSRVTGNGDRVTGAADEEGGHRGARDAGGAGVVVGALAGKLPVAPGNDSGKDHSPATAQDHGTRPACPSPLAELGAPGMAPRETLGRLAQRRGHLFEALLSAAHRYESHLRGEVVEACLWFEPYLGERFWGLLAQPRSKLPRLVAELLIGSDEPAAAYLLMQAMSVAELRPQAVKAISERRDGKWFRAALRGVEMWHPWPRVRRGWNFIKDIAYLYTLDEAGWASLGEKAALPILIAASNPGLQNKTMLMERLLKQATGRECRRQILMEACRGKDWGVPILEAALRQSSDPAELRMAAYGLLGVSHEGLVGDLAKRLSTLGDAAPAGLVALTADLVFWRLWTRFDAMAEERRVTALAGIRGFAGYIKDRLRVNLASGSTSHRLRAVRVAGLLGLVEELWKDMRLAAQGPSPRVRSAAVRFLGRSSRPELRQQLLAALEDPDGRVQANALEAMDEGGWPDQLDLIVPKLHSEHSRVRANAAKALVRAGDEQAVRVLTEMLEDSRAEYRVTAIWTIKQIGAGVWAEKLAQLAENDPSPVVRRNARGARRALQAGTTGSSDQGSGASKGNGGITGRGLNDNGGAPADDAGAAAGVQGDSDSRDSMAANDAAMAPGAHLPSPLGGASAAGDVGTKPDPSKRVAANDAPMAPAKAAMAPGKAAKALEDEPMVPVAPGAAAVPGAGRGRP